MNEPGGDKTDWIYEDGYMNNVLERGLSLVLNYPVQDNRRRGFVPGSDLEPNPLREYFETKAKVGPGVWKYRHYFEAYNRHLSKFVGRSPVVVEIGIWSGGSLKMWKEYLGAGCRIHGVDIDPGCKMFADETTTVHIGNEDDPNFWADFRRKVPNVDVVIDDGNHHPEAQIRVMEGLFHHVRRGGVYICEDICGKGNPFVALSCAMIDRLHEFDPAFNDQLHLPEGIGEITPFQSHISGIHYYPFMVVFEKRDVPLLHFSSQKQGTEWRPMYWKKCTEPGAIYDVIAAPSE